MIEITHAIARKVLTVVDAGLVSGVGNPVLGEMCVEAAVCFALGEKHGDQPTCVHPALRVFKIGLNDAGWSSPQSRANGLRRLALAQLGSNAAFDVSDFARRLAMMTVNKTVPRVLRIAAAMKLPPQNSQALEYAASKCEAAINLAAARDAARAASDAASDAARAASSYAASDAARAASDAARDAARAASDAASDAARDAARAASAASYAASSYAARYAANDKELATTAEDVVQILIAMDAPGCQWLDMAPLPVMEH
jgi:hypothetical protein